MPVVIRELHVKVNVDEGTANRPQQPESARSENRDALISECVEKVMEILKLEKLR